MNFFLLKKKQNVAHTKNSIWSRSHLNTCHSWPMAQSILETLFKQQQISSSFLCDEMCFGWIPTHIDSTAETQRLDCVRKFWAEQTSNILYKSITHTVKKSLQMFIHQAFCCCFMCCFLLFHIRYCWCFYISTMNEVLTCISMENSYTQIISKGLRRFYTYLLGVQCYEA